MKNISTLLAGAFLAALAVAALAGDTPGPTPQPPAAATAEVASLDRPAVAIAPSPAARAADAVVRIYLPRDIQVDGDSIALDHIAVVCCDDAETAVKASAVLLGRAPWSGESIAIDRTTILSRLASAGIPAARVQCSGADKITVRRAERTISRDEIMKVVETFLLKSRPVDDDARLQIVRDANDLLLPEGKDVSLKPRLCENAPAGQVKVSVLAMADGKQVAATEVTFRVVYPARQAVAAKEIPSGSALTPENTRIETITGERKAMGEWTSPIGMIAMQRVPAGAVIRPGILMSPKPAIVLKQNQSVTMRLEGVGFRIMAQGEALEDGRPGEYIKVRNSDTKRIVMAKVALDGTVEPVYEEKKP